MIEQKLRKARRCAQRGDMAQAQQLYQSILSQYPKNAAALQGLRALAPRLTATDAPSPAQLNALEHLYQQGQYRTLIQQTQTLVASFPKVALLHNIIGSAYKELEQLDAAIAAYRQAISIAPNYYEAYSNIGVCLKQQGEYDKAIEVYAMALQLKPNSVEIHSDLGLLYKDMGRIDEAMQQQRHALQIEPDCSMAHTRLGILLKDTGQYEQALACHHRVLELDPNFVGAYTNLAITNRLLNRYDDVLENYNQIIALSPDDADARFDRSMVMLLTGDFTNGWREYEWRPSGSKNGVDAIGFSQPLWLGDSDITAKTILIHCEQGMGDTLHFSRYVKMVADLGAKVIFQVQEQLASLFESFDSYATIVAGVQSPLPEFDVYCPLLSLPLAFATELNSIPAGVGYLHAPSAKIKHWRARLGARDRPRIGIVWRGNLKYGEDHRRSMSLALVLEHLPSDYDYISLQYEVADEDRPLLSRLNHVGEDFNDFADTAAVCMQLDVLISVDTSVAHLGGALGLPTWILLPYCPDFRWLLDRSDSPWYPTARLFRQPELHNWSSVLTEVSRALHERFDCD